MSKSIEKTVRGICFFIMFCYFDCKCFDFIGIFPNALINYITMSGGGFDRRRGEGIIPYTMEELADKVRRFICTFIFNLIYI